MDDLTKKTFARHADSIEDILWSMVINHLPKLKK